MPYRDSFQAPGYCEAKWSRFTDESRLRLCRLVTTRPVHPQHPVPQQKRASSGALSEAKTTFPFFSHGHRLGPVSRRFASYQVRLALEPGCHVPMTSSGYGGCGFAHATFEPVFRFEHEFGESPVVAAHAAAGSPPSLSVLSYTLLPTPRIALGTVEARRRPIPSLREARPPLERTPPVLPTHRQFVPLSHVPADTKTDCIFLQKDTSTIHWPIHAS